MAEDVVTQLQQLSASLGRGEGRSTVLGAAAEIERLRARCAAADDIVARLRSAARSGDLPLGVAFNCDAVADEIERLRAAGDALVAAIRHHDLTETRLKGWEEARRG